MMRNSRGDAPVGGGEDLRHPGWERLNDHADGRLDPVADADVRAHLAACARCRAVVVGVQQLAASALALPPSIDPPAALWDDIATTIAALPAREAPIVSGRAQSPAPGVASGARTGRGAQGERDDARAAAPAAVARRMATRYAREWLAAAALVLMALSSGLTALYLQRDDADRAVAPVAGTALTPADGAASRVPAGLPASFTATETAYLANVAELEALLVAQRGALTPATVAVVESALATIDAAIAEARAALLADPANHELAELLGANYRQKVELLRRAAEFPHAL